MIGRIYKITSSNTDKIYIGSTTKKLTERLRKHKNDYNCFKNGKKHFIKSYDILEKKDYEIQLLEKIEYETKKELLEREGYYILKYRDICVNICIPGRTKEQYRKDNANKMKQYRIDNADKLKQYRIDNADKMKQYYKDNADKIKEVSKQYIKDNADKIRENKSEKLDCACGGRFTRSNKARHEKAIIHIKYVSEN